MLEKLKKKILFSIVTAGIIYLVLVIYADYENVVNSFKQFNWFVFPVLLLLSLCNYFVRFTKWHYYLQLLKVKILFVDSFAIFMSGLIMSITPGKMGELLKAYLVKQVNGEPVSKTGPIIFAERITDFVSLVLIALLGAYSFDFGRTIIIGVAIFFFLVILVISYKPLALLFFSLFEKVSFLRKHLEKFHTAYESSYIMLKTGPLLYMTLVSLVSWFFECFGYYLILKTFNVDASLWWASFSYAFATIVGAITMLPGGLGVTEGSLTLFLIKKGTTQEVAVASTFIIRVVTLWFAVVVGVIAVLFYQKRIGKINVEDNQLKEVEI